MAAITQAEFDAWKVDSGHAAFVDDAVEALLNPTNHQNIAHARLNLETLINEQDGQHVDGNSPDSLLFSYANATKEIFATTAARSFEANPEGFLDKSLADFSENLTQNYANIRAYAEVEREIDGKKRRVKEPLKTGNGLFDNALQYHYIGSCLEDTIKDHQKLVVSSRGANRLEIEQSFAQSTIGLVAKEFKLYLMTKMRIEESDKEGMEKINSIVEVFMQAYVRTPEKVDGIVNFAHARAYKTLDTILPKDQRASYVHAALKAKVGAGDIAGAAKDLYSAIKEH